MITLEQVRKAYGSEATIGPVDLAIPTGGMTALVGPNGARKSTLLTMIGRLLDADEETIRVADMDVGSAKSKDLAKIVSILRQENHFVTRLTVHQLVGFGRFSYSGGRLTAEDEKIISRYIEFLGLGDLQGRFLEQLSGGQRQRAYVAMVLCQETEHVLLDEPLNNLDIAHSVEMMQYLHHASRELGRTIVIVLHDINFATRYADYICAAKDGQMYAFGTPAEIMHDDLLTEIFNTPVKVIEGPNGPLATYH